MTKERKELFDMTQECMDSITEKGNEQTMADYRAYSLMCNIQRLLTPIPAEIEGGGSTWYTVCGDCHGVIDSNELYCKHCGREIDWQG